MFQMLNFVNKVHTYCKKYAYDKCFYISSLACFSHKVFIKNWLYFHQFLHKIIKVGKKKGVWVISCDLTTLEDINTDKSLKKKHHCQDQKSKSKPIKIWSIMTELSTLMSYKEMDYRPWTWTGILLGGQWDHVKLSSINGGRFVRFYVGCSDLINKRVFCQCFAMTFLKLKIKS